MPKQKKKGGSLGKVLLVVVLIAVVSVGYIAWHDGLIGVTPMGDINNLSIPGGTPVRLRGRITGISSLTVTVTDGTGTVIFDWTGPLAIGQTVVIDGVVGSAHVMQSVSAVTPVWIFSLPS